MTLLERLHRELTQRRARLRDLLNITGREMSPAEAREFDTLTSSSSEDGIVVLEERIAEIEAQDARGARAQAELAAQQRDAQRTSDGPGPSGWSVGRQARTYGPTGASWLRDAISVHVTGDYTGEARERLARNSREVADMGRQERALTTIDGAGGDLVPPAWLIEQAVVVARAARVTADRATRLPLPSGTDSVNIPKILTGTAVAEQATQNTPVQNTDATTGAISANVATLAGQQVLSVQLVEQSPASMDQLLLQDLLADLAVKIDLFALSSNAVGKFGLLNTTGIPTIAVTAVTAAGIYAKIADAVQRVATTRFVPPDCIVMHPRRWAMLASATDSTGRPLVVPVGGGGFNSMGAGSAAANDPASGYVGTLLGYPVYVDPQIPVTRGAGNNEDVILVGRFADAVLWESTPRAEVFRETYAPQLSVLLRCYEYVAFTGARYPGAFAILTGLTPPAF